MTDFSGEPSLDWVCGRAPLQAFEAARGARPSLALDDAPWTSLRLALQQIPHAWKRDEAALRRCLEAVLRVLRTGAPWCDLLFKQFRPALPAEGLVLADSMTCKAHRAAAGAAHSTPEAKSLGRSH